MRRTRRWLLAFMVLAALVAGAVAFYYTFVDTAYSRAEFYADTGFVPVPTQPDSASLLTYGEKPRHVVLMVTRGEPHGIVTTDHGWSDTLRIEIPTPSGGEHIDLSGSDSRIAFSSFDGRQFPRIGEGGVKGHLDIESVGTRRIVASYDLVIDGVYPRFVPEHRHRDVVFRGRSTFRVRARPEGEFFGEVWPPMTREAATR
jgi:hypothetical protein